MIEIGYMRRIPILKEDELKAFKHLETGQDIRLKTPKSEEIFGNKFCTLIYRYNDETQMSSRDLFDVFKISKQKFEEEMFLTALVIDSLMRPEPRIYKQDIEGMMSDVSIDEQVSRLIRKEKIPKDLKRRSLPFIQRYISLAEERYKELIDTFFDKQEFNPESFVNYDELHESIDSHPAILWNLQQLKDAK